MPGYEKEGGTTTVTDKHTIHTANMDMEAGGRPARNRHVGMRALYVVGP